MPSTLLAATIAKLLVKTVMRMVTTLQSQRLGSSGRFPRTHQKMCDEEKGGEQSLAEELYAIMSMSGRNAGFAGGGARYNWTKFPKPRRLPVSGLLGVDCRMPTAGVKPIRIWNKAYLDLQFSFGSTPEAGMRDSRDIRGGRVSSWKAKREGHKEARAGDQYQDQ